MRNAKKRAAGVILAAGMLMSTAIPLLPQMMTSIVANAGENDFNWNTYPRFT